MPTHIYIKERPSAVKKHARHVSYFILVVGSCLLFWAYYPIISFEIYSRLFLREDVTTPVADTTTTSLRFAQTVYAGNNLFTNNLRDFTNANVWFPASDSTGMRGKIDIQEYSLSIPRLNLKELKVRVGGDDLSKSLIHYIPTSKPGQYGNIAIFGHSTLPQLFDAKNYKTVFTYLPQLETGDKVFINSQGNTYTYEVYDIFIVQPNQVSVLEQNFSGSFLTLITCVPPGTFEKRLIVKARLVKRPAF